MKKALNTPSATKQHTEKGKGELKYLKSKKQHKKKSNSMITKIKYRIAIKRQKKNKNNIKFNKWNKLSCRRILILYIYNNRTKD